ncbi:hypothetical protein NNJEOMEG_02330 [Fundidesulfovibrio magnetotacticus]|uniref:SGNH hydrolase-type esterase domain-containing protein n=1 Tax=Fundidesulfovibrio magnetotacticus TaxID=2730080 RepID=A0A6V8LRX9_9BACT|nr:hypothetical protein [Fundidesulfovibrio magnetotacticus]GFK94484.1 hypothetical protein NNJEOMEG_02330 [Fundidesulfovibrio magnetotacticus]
MNNIARTVALVILSTWVLILLAEAVLHVVSSAPEYVNYEFHPDLAGDLPPNVSVMDTLIKGLPYRVSTNAQGLRAQEPLLPRDEVGVRVLCLGDSFTFGVGVDDKATYPFLLQQFLRKAMPGKVVDVVNSGIPFFDIVDELDYWYQKGQALKPDVVVCQFYYNDLQTMNGRSFRRERRAQSAPYSRVKAVLKESRLFALAASLAYRLASIAPAASGGGASGADPWYEGRYCSDMSPEIMEIVRGGVLDAANNGALACRWDKYLANLLELKSAVEATGARFVLVMIPDEAQLAAPLAGPDVYFQSVLPGLGVDALDLLFVFREVHHRERLKLYNSPLDFHTNAQGNTLVAKLTAESVLRTLSVRDDAPPDRAKGFPGSWRVAFRFGAHGLEADQAPPGGERVEVQQSQTLHWQGMDTVDGPAVATTYADVPGELTVRVTGMEPSTYLGLTLHPIVYNEAVNGGIRIYVELDNGQVLQVLDRENSTPQGTRLLCDLFFPDKPFRAVTLRFVIGKSTGLAVDKAKGSTSSQQLTLRAG